MLGSIDRTNFAGTRARLVAGCWKRDKGSGRVHAPSRQHLQSAVFRIVAERRSTKIVSSSTGDSLSQAVAIVENELMASCCLTVVEVPVSVGAESGARRGGETEARQAALASRSS